MNSENSFQEVQKFRQPFLWIVLSPPILAAWAGFVCSFFGMTPFGETSFHALVLMIWVALGIALPILFFMLKLEVEVGDDGIYYRFFPLQFKHRRIGFAEIKSYKSVTYQPIKDYGGWGIRWGRNGKAYSVGGNLGVQFELRNGKRILLGSKKPKDLVDGIKTKIKAVRMGR